eukprot:TRINITY_DN21857_c0_g1_i1.p1 TRINITY_DN21857_c0_g1~~TRINITY_DN21857_c0_g1_i1.p1  ORF type:complete len:484 (-),score=267.31 TRINITY_DN21857_c0_g1_i1:68-1519(-)
MSKDWEVVQEKAFTAWVNGVLEAEEKVSDITTDFGDGIRLIHFLERLGGKKIGKRIEEKAQSRIHKIQNLHLALQFTNELDVQAQGIGAEDFVDANKKMILGYLWALYRKYRIAVIKEGDKSSEEGLLLWCKNTTADYSGVDIKTFKTGFRDGNAYLALTHAYDPTQFSYDDFQNESPEARLEKAFELAEKNINIPKLLDASEVIKGTTDERSLILYTSLFFHAFGAKAQKDALDAAQRDAANKLGNLQDSLQSAQMSKDQLLKQKGELEASKAELTNQLNGKTKEAEEKDQEIARLKAELEASKQKNSELETKLTGLEASLAELQSKFTTVEAEKKEISVTLEEKSSKLKEEQKTNESLTGKVSSLESDKENLTAKLESASKNLDSKGKQSDTELSALLLLRQQFDQHVLDMHRWRKLAEVDVADFITETKTPLVEELAKEGGFDKQLELLKGKVDEETKDIHKYLAEKEELAKQRTKSQKK